MMKYSRPHPRKLNLQTLEKRQLLAGDFCQIGGIELTAEGEAIELSTTDESEDPLESASRLGEVAFPSRYHFGFDHNEPDFLFEIGNQVVAIENVSLDSTVRVFDRAESGELTLRDEESLHVISVEDSFLIDGRLYVAGRSNAREVAHAVTFASDEARLEFFRPKWHVSSIDLSSADAQWQHQTFDNELVEILHDDSQLVAITREVQDFDQLDAPIDGEFKTYSLAVFDYTEDGLLKRETTTSFETMSTSRFDRPTPFDPALTTGSLYVLANPLVESGSVEGGDQSVVTSVLNQYSITSSGIELSSALTVDEGGDSSNGDNGSATIAGSYAGRRSLEVSQDGLTATIVEIAAPRFVHNEDFSEVVPGLTTISMIDLSQDQPSIFDAFTLPNFKTHSFSSVGESLVLAGERLDSRESAVAIINLNQQIDIESTNRINLLETPNGRVVLDALPISSNRIAFLGSGALPQDGIAPLLPTAPALVVLDVESNQWILESEIPLVHEDIKFSNYDVATGRVTFTASPIDRERYSGSYQGRPARDFLVGDLQLDSPDNTENRFEITDRINADAWLEADETSQRLLVRMLDRLVQFDWADLESGIVTPIGELIPPVEAFDDQFNLIAEGRGVWLDVLANDQVTRRPYRAYTEIVKLKNAPEGLVYYRGSNIWVPNEILREIDEINFQYTISNGLTSSTANVHLVVDSITESEAELLSDRILDQAAEDLSVSREEISILSTQQVVSANGAAAIEVVIAADRIRSMYQATADETVSLISTETLHQLMELELHAVDQSGARIESVEVGEPFYVVISGTDLRPGGAGIFGIGVDLEFLASQLQVVDEPESIGTFQVFSDWKTEAGLINELSAFDRVIRAPGNAVQHFVRIPMTASETGEALVTMNPPETPGAEMLLRDIDGVIPNIQIGYGSLELRVVERSPESSLDVDGNGEVTSADALRVINFIGKYGSVSLDGTAGQLGESEFGLVNSDLGNTGAGLANLPSMAEMQSLDANRSGSVSAIDALVIINRLSVIVVGAEAELPSSLEDDADRFDQIMATIDGPALF